MPKASAGILMYQRHGHEVKVLLAHPGGPFWRHRDAGAWTIPKGEIAAGETAEAAARREFAEELGMTATAALLPLGSLRQRGGKTVEAFAMAGAFDTTHLRSNTFELAWPPHGGRLATFPEVDRAEWLALPAARQKILPSQAVLLDRLEAILGDAAGRPERNRRD